MTALLAAAPQARAVHEAPRGTVGARRDPLAAECDALLAAALKTPYGWGWKDGTRRAWGAGARAGAARVVTIDSRATAAAGLVLYLAGDRLDEPRYTQAARQAARALAAVQLDTGQIPALGVFRANAGGRDPPRAVPSRAATCAGLGLFLALEHDAGDASAPAAGGANRRAAAKAAHWLAAQQTRWGGWIVTHPAGAAPGDGTRLVRLDDASYRDAAVALSLAAHVLEDERLARQARAAVEDLDLLRIEDEKSPGYRLWTTAYTADRVILTTVPEFSPAVDTLAARNAMQALLAACLLGEADAARPVLREAAAALEKLPKENGAWRSRYDLIAPAPKPDVAPSPETTEEPPVSGLFPPVTGDGSDGTGESEAAIGVDRVVGAAGRLESLGPEAFADAMAARLAVEYRLGLLLCGLCNDAVTLELPPADESATDDVYGRMRRIARRVWRLGPAENRRNPAPDREEPGGR